MEEVLKKIERLKESLTPEELKKMSSEERKEYLKAIEELQASVDVLVDVMKGGN
ncbi:MAG: hypothetical protein IKD76_02840 [Clostridia bacterium]|nr:hypothetical protein [Clostridia bacterium]